MSLIFSTKTFGCTWCATIVVSPIDSIWTSFRLTSKRDIKRKMTVTFCRRSNQTTFQNLRNSHCKTTNAETTPLFWIFKLTYCTYAYQEAFWGQVFRAPWNKNLHSQQTVMQWFHSVYFIFLFEIPHLIWQSRFKENYVVLQLWTAEILEGEAERGFRLEDQHGIALLSVKFLYNKI